MGKKKYLGLAALLCLCLSGCAETPEEAPVVSKAGGMLQNHQAEVIPEGEFRELDVPSHWTETLERGNGQVTIEADVDIRVPQLGNIPVAELEPLVLTDEILGKLCAYFAGDRELYHPGARSKAQLIEEYERMKGKEGNYGNPYYKGTTASLLSKLEKLIEEAPEQEGEREKVEPVFAPEWYWEKDAALGKSIDNADQNKKEKFTAWVDTGKGVENDPVITAQKQGSIQKFSMGVQTEDGGFTYKTADILAEELDGENDLAAMKAAAENNTVGAGEGFQKQVQAYEEALEEPEITEQEARETAEKVLKDLGIEGVLFTKASRALIVPRNGCWNGPGADLSQAETGYTLLYYRSGIEGAEGWQQENATLYENLPETSYAPPFLQESVRITVGKEGICGFEWLNPAKETGTAAENVELIPFEEAAGRMADHLLYAKASMDELNGFDSSKMSSRYEVKAVKLCMVYVNAYEKPGHCWLVPAWAFELQWYLKVQGQAEIKREQQYCVISAVDGGYISPF